MKEFVYGLLLALFAARGPAVSKERAIEVEMVLEAPLEEVWSARTTPEGGASSTTYSSRTALVARTIRMLCG
jgi:hypothetical protein